MNLLTKLRYVPKHFGVAIAIVLAGLGTALTFAWGPSRTTYTMESPADHVVFNSITNNPEVGDEREFLTVRDLTTGQPLSGSTTVVAGHEYLFQVYVHNNAASNFNDASYNYKGIATGTTAEVAIPSSVNGSVDAAAYVRASNAAPTEVWDTVKLTSSSNITLDYQEGTARLFTNYFTNGQALNDNLITSNGVMIGYNALDGRWPGCLQYAGTITFRVKAIAPTTTNYTVQKEVRKAGTSTFVESVAVNPGDKVNYRMVVTDTGSSTLNNVMLKDALPAGMTFVPGTVRIMDSNNPGGAYVQNGDNLVTSGVNIGSFSAGSNAIVIFDATVKANDQLPTCGANTLTNTATVTPEGQTPKSDTAVVTTNKTCEAPKPVYTCNGMTIDKISRTEFKFSVSKTVQNATYVKTMFVVRSANGTEVARVDDVDGILNYTQTTVGKYTVEATIVVKVDGVEKTATSDNCKKPFEIEAVPTGKVEVCDPSDRKIKQVDEKDADKYLPVGSDKCATMTVCVIATGEMNKTIFKDQFDSKVYSTAENDCKKTVTPPTVIPSTGPEALLGGLSGVSALSYGAYTYMTSRRALKNARK